MGDIAEVTGMIISAMPVGEFDRRVVIVTKERGKISAFAKGARRLNSPLMGITRAFIFGRFQLYEGRNSYNIRQVEVFKYFENIISDLDAVCYACYFAEIADYYTREGIDASEVINLLYVSLQALVNPNISDLLIRYIYELRMIAINGECPDISTQTQLSQSAMYTMQYIVTSPLKKLYTFTVSDSVLNEIGILMNELCLRTFDKIMKSKEMLP